MPTNEPTYKGLTLDQWHTLYQHVEAAYDLVCDSDEREAIFNAEGNAWVGSWVSSAFYEMGSAVADAEEHIEDARQSGMQKLADAAEEDEDAEQQ